MPGRILDVQILCARIIYHEKTFRDHGSGFVVKLYNIILF